MFPKQSAAREHRAPRTRRGFSGGACRPLFPFELARERSLELCGMTSSDEGAHPMSDPPNGAKISLWRSIPLNLGKQRSVR
jgi:hypothetical protein